MSRKKNRLFIERMKATKYEEKDIKVQSSVTKKIEKQQSEIVKNTSKPKEESRETVKNKSQKKKQHKQPKTQQSYRKKRKKTSIFAQNVFARLDAEVAEQKRKEEYQKVVYKKMEESEKEGFDR